MSKVSGHSGLPEEIELRMMEEKMQGNKERKEERFRSVLDLMNSLGIAPHERKTFIIAFAKWMEGR